MYKVALIAAFVVAGCAYEIPGEKPVMAHFPEEVETAVSEWSKDYSACDPSEVTFVIAGPETFKELCPTGAKKGSLGCHTIVPRPERHVLVARDDRPEETTNTITHELMHWLADCSGDFPDSQEDHDDPSIWGEGGILDRTNRALGLPSDR